MNVDETAFTFDYVIIRVRIRQIGGEVVRGIALAKSITCSDARSCQCRKVRIRHEIFFDEPLACLVTLPKFSDSLRLYDRKFFASKRVGRFSVLFKSAHLISLVRSRPNTIFLEGLSIKRLTAALSLPPSPSSGIWLFVVISSRRVAADPINLYLR